MIEEMVNLKPRRKIEESAPVTVPISSRAGRAVVWRLAQVVGVNAIFFVRVLVLARLLAPDAFGLLAVALVPIGILLQASELGMIPALVQARAPSHKDYDVAWTMSLVRGLTTTGLVFQIASLANLYFENVLLTALLVSQGVVRLVDPVVHL